MISIGSIYKVDETDFDIRVRGVSIRDIWNGDLHYHVTVSDIKEK